MLILSSHLTHTCISTRILLFPEEVRGGGRGSYFKDKVKLLLPFPDGVCQSFCLSDAILNIRVERSGVMCVCACVQKSLAFLFFREKECWHKASHYGRSRRLECWSASPGLFHFICTVMSLVTAVSWELKVKPHKGRNAGKKGGKVNTKEGKTDKPPNVHLKTCEHFGTRGAIKRNFFGGGVVVFVLFTVPHSFQTCPLLHRALKRNLSTDRQEVWKSWLCLCMTVRMCVYLSASEGACVCCVRA